MKPPLKVPAKLADLRLRIDDVDRELARLFSQRFELAERILEEKVNLNLPIKDAQREQEILENLRQTLGAEPCVEEIFLIFDCILKMSCEYMRKKRKTVP